MKLKFIITSYMIPILMSGPVSLAEIDTEIISIERRISIENDLYPFVKEQVWLGAGPVNSSISLGVASASQVSNVGPSGFPAGGRLAYDVGDSVDYRILASSVFSMNFRVITTSDLHFRLSLQNNISSQIFSLIRDPDGIREFVSYWDEGDSVHYNDFSPTFNLLLDPDEYLLELVAYSTGDQAVEFGFYVPSPGAGAILGLGFIACLRRRGVGESKH